MATVTIQDIESVDDYWGPTFRAILEADATDQISELIESRIKHHDKDIERICNLYYQGFIESIRELLHVRTQTKNLNHEVMALDESLRTVSKDVLTKGHELVRSRQVEGNIVNTVHGLQSCLPVLDCYAKLLRQVKEKRYYPALKTLEQLENEHLPKVAHYRFTAQMKNAVPKLKQMIKHSSEADFREFLENIRKFSPKIGEVAMRHTKQMQSRTLDDILDECEKHLAGDEGGEAEEDDEDDVSAQDLIDFSPIYRCLHIYTVLNDREYFENDWRKQRRDQAKLVLQAPQTMHDNLEAYKHYIYSIVGFFIVEDHVLNTGGDIVTRSYLDDLWSSSLSRAVNVLSMNSSSCTDPNILLRIKNLIMLSITTLKTHGYPVTQLWELLLEMRDHYNEVLLQRWVNVFREILDRCDFQPLQVDTAEEFESVVDRFPFHSEALESQSQFPKAFPFSRMVPEVYHQTKEFMYACMKFSEELTLSPNEVASMVRKAANLLLTRSFSGCLSAVFHRPSLAPTQLIQIIVDTQYLEKASPFLDAFVCDMTSTQPTVSQTQASSASSLFHVARAEAEMQVPEKLCAKLDEFFSVFEEYNWLLSQSTGQPSLFIRDMVTYLKSTFENMSATLPGVAQTACKKSCLHIALKIHQLLIGEEVKLISSGALQQVSLDLMQCEYFAGKASRMVPGLSEEELLRNFAKVRQLCNLLLDEEWSAYLHDYGKAENAYSQVQPEHVIVVLEKIREADKKTMFAMVKKSERDKKKLVDTVLNQLRQLAEKQG